MSFVTYSHAKEDGTIFYIGKGTEKRAYSKYSRNRFWNNVVNKYSFVPQVLAHWDTEEAAFEHEKLLIACFKDLGYELVNFTNGGEGTSGYKWTQEQLKTLSEAHKGINKGLFSGIKNPSYGQIKEKNKKYKGKILATNIKTDEMLVLEGSNDIESKGFNRGHVAACLTGKRKTHKGFTFKRIEKHEQKTENSNLRHIEKRRTIC